MDERSLKMTRLTQGPVGRDFMRWSYLGGCVWRMCIGDGSFNKSDHIVQAPHATNAITTCKIGTKLSN